MGGLHVICHLHTIAGTSNIPYLLFYSPMGRLRTIPADFTFYSSMRTNHLSLAIIGLLICITSSAAPRLTVAVVVDGMRQESLDQLRPYWQQGGLRTLSEEAYQTTIRFPHIVYGGSECLATMMTGTTPSVHGIAADSYFLRSDRRPHAILEDKSEQGVGCSAALSPQAVKVSIKTAASSSAANFFVFFMLRSPLSFRTVFLKMVFSSEGHYSILY